MEGRFQFKSAPVFELVLGVQFDAPVFNSETIFHAFETFKSEYPRINEHPPLPEIIEPLGKANITRFVPGIQNRKLFINESNTKLIQIQANKLLFNWRRASKQTEYPRFRFIKDDFFTVFNKLDERYSLNEKVNQLEMTYVDRVLQSEFGRSDFNPSSALKVVDDSREFSSLDLTYAFGVPVLNGNMTVKLSSATQKEDEEPIVIVETTCRGAFSEGIGTIDKWFDEAHNTHLDYFSSIITEEAKSKWGFYKV